jgi:phosphohistidine phosphatase
MRVFLVQHGKAHTTEQDPERTLSREGLSETQRIAEVAGHYGVQPSKVLHSGKARARQTAELLAQQLNPPNGLESFPGLSPMDDVALFAKQLPENDEWMVVGHLPFVSRLTSYLVVGDADKPIFSFQNSGIVCLEKQPDAEQWLIKWTLMPNIR